MIVTAVIQARMGSTRLPGKVMRQLGRNTVLGHVLERLLASELVDRHVVATSWSPTDDIVGEEARRCGARVTRGPEDDVLGRYILAFDEHGGDIGVRITADCPLIDVGLLDQGVHRFAEADPPLDYLSNTVKRSFPRGYDFEVFSVRALRCAADLASDPADREHVTRYLYRHPEQFRIGTFSRDDPNNSAAWRLTLDTPDDWRVIEEIMLALDMPSLRFGLQEVERYVGEHPDVLTWNAHVTQKET